MSFLSAEQLFSICGLLVMPAWLLLALAPKWVWTQKLVSHGWIPILLAIAYGFAMWQGQPSPEGGGFDSLKEVAILFQSPWLLLAGWIHYLAFDLFIGAWQVRDAQRRSINHVLIIPCLALTFLAGPIGLLLYFIIRLIFTNSLTSDELAK